MKKLIVLSIAVMALCLWTMPAMAQMTENAKAYETIIDNFIMKCEQKTAMMDTQGDNLREDVRTSLMKASFYKKNKEVLIEEMIEKDVDPDSYKVQHFLNERFFAIVRDNNPTVAEAYSEPDEVSVPRKK